MVIMSESNNVWKFLTRIDQFRTVNEKIIKAKLSNLKCKFPRWRYDENTSTIPRLKLQLEQQLNSGKEEG